MIAMRVAGRLLTIHRELRDSGGTLAASAANMRRSAVQQQETVSSQAAVAGAVGGAGIGPAYRYDTVLVPLSGYERDAAELLSRLLTTEPDTVLPFLTTDFGAVMAFARNYIAPQIQRGQEAGHIKGLPADVIAEMILRTIHSMMLTRVGVINPGDEASIRSFAQQFLRPLLTP
mgnify:CR=1 FL=1